MKLLKLALLLVVIQSALAQQPTVSFTGTVVDAASGRPLARATLELRQPNAPITSGYPGTSNEQGQFVFQNVPAGLYTLTAAKNGYVRTGYGQRGPNGKAMQLPLAANRPAPPIRITMTQAGAISGKIADPDGLPYPYVQISARRVLFTNGLRTLTQLSATYTNDLGEYRLWNLPPGQYLIAADVNTNAQGITPVSATMIPPLPGAIVIDPITRGSMNAIPDPANANVRRNANALDKPRATAYYRNTSDDRLATLVDLKPGNDLNGIDFVAGTTPTLPATINVPPGTTQMRLSITPGQTTIAVNFRPGAAASSFQFSMAPGSYTLSGQGQDSANNPFVAYGAADVNPLNPTPVNLAVSTPIEVSGRIAAEGQADTSKFRIVLRRNPMLSGLPGIVIAPKDGTFSGTQALVPGVYAIELQGVAGAYIKSIQLQGNLLASNTIPVGGQAITGLEIAIGMNGGQLDGNAIAPSGEAWSNVTVVLVPNDRSRYDLYKILTTDEAGHFRFEGLTPGRYKLFSWEDVEPDAWLNPDFLRTQDQDSRGQQVQIFEGATEKLNAQIIPMR